METNETVLKEIDIMQIGGFKVGHAEDQEAGTGCTVLLFDKQSPAGVDVRGGGPASRETPLLNPVADCKGLHALLLSGGSAYALNAATGVMNYLEERGIGLPVGPTVVPLVCQSDIFDLGFGRADVRPDEAMAYRACKNASYSSVPQGNYGVGCGCTVGKLMGPENCMKSGVGCYAVQVGELMVGAIVAVNALGDVYDMQTGRLLAGCHKDGHLVSSEDLLYKLAADQKLSNTNTTIGAIITNAKMDKTTLCKVASMAHNGYARTIRPVHTMADGDSIYACSVGEVASDVNIVGTLAAHVMGMAVNNAVLHAESMLGAIACRDL